LRGHGPLGHDPPRSRFASRGTAIGFGVSVEGEDVLINAERISVSEEGQLVGLNADRVAVAVFRGGLWRHAVRAVVGAADEENAGQ
jgi:hypothetical protein